jgi:hypothetical protein
MGIYRVKAVKLYRLYPVYFMLGVWQSDGNTKGVKNDRYRKELFLCNSS